MNSNHGKIWLIGGTSDSVTIAETIAFHEFCSVVTVTTASAKKLYPIAPNLMIEVGQLDRQGMRKLCHQKNITAIIDASHPYAVNISQQVINFSQEYCIPYLRYERPCLPINSQVIQLDSFDTLINGDYLAEKRVLLTVGCNPLHLFKTWQNRSILYARILPKISSLEIGLKAGFSSDRLIALRPPIIAELEKALWQQWDINLVITKASGELGGEDIKSTVATELGIPLIIINRPKLIYPQQTEQLSDIIKFCEQYC
ncbi:cobalt-precorrin-6A reductase [Aphanothece sacrum]|uniref:Cobalt-precorrin-6x reductase n=1 Tax=Aphanothece sacrum FPU1 TaxID=1920663 RepID=A0A401IFH1_APHSA|nr:cobalt-precorrin-6A reductase [Aphanothece sacrum]GBF80033.1 cobalt-precorrin-6x reductase [Aphanothece sacrum FPU1]GBF84576.1 cobalt-precorrin-6X reductase [Aphanothece sacrum FPU3]